MTTKDTAWSQEYVAAAADAATTSSGEFVDLAGERYYLIRDVDAMPPFFFSLISNADHWLFASSTGGMTAGRVSPEKPLFPYIPVDRIHECGPHTGSKTVFRIRPNGNWSVWEPFAVDPYKHYNITTNLYKSVLGNRIIFEQVNHDLDVSFRVHWMVSDRFGFVRHCELLNNGNVDVRVDVLDGLQNLLPPGTSRLLQSSSSNLVDAYKWSELDQATGLGLFTLYSAITDRAMPCESLKANTVFCAGVDDFDVLLSTEQVPAFIDGMPVRQELRKRGVRGAYLARFNLLLEAGSQKSWQIVSNVDLTQAEVVELRKQLHDPDSTIEQLFASVKQDSLQLERIMASADATQLTANEYDLAHHYSNVQFNVLRGGVVDDQYVIHSTDFRRTVRQYNVRVYDRHRDLLESLPPHIDRISLYELVKESGDNQLMRLMLEYLPITFGRRHGDPSRPWNQFEIRLKDDEGKPLLSYQGNWRDIFQNWEALALSYPEFIEGFIFRFVNATTVDGYNPYRITKDGIDWEVEEPDNEWSYIGYWGDHQIIYLLKFLEQSLHYHPDRLQHYLHRRVFCYANVPYRLRPIEDTIRDAKHTIDFDAGLHHIIQQRVGELGADGRLLLDAEGSVYQVNLMEKLLVPLLAKLSNFVVGAGVWLNTQRPEWNDANNALVGYGISAVTMYYMRRYLQFMRDLVAEQQDPFSVSAEVANWMADVAHCFTSLRSKVAAGDVDDSLRHHSVLCLGQAASRYREAVYAAEGFSGESQLQAGDMIKLFDDALFVIDGSIADNLRDDGLYHAYNLMDIEPESIGINNLYPMLEGQVAALSAGVLPPAEVITLLEALFDSSMYREDQQTFMLYPDRELPGFLNKNRISAELVASIPLLAQMLTDGETDIILQDTDGQYRFNADLTNAEELDASLDELVETYGDRIEAARGPIHHLYETVFNHQAFTGRSGGMFGFEGLGCIYWHMVSKLLLAVQECYFAAADQQADDKQVRRIAELYYRVRHGLGFNKTPAEYGAFPTDCYSHTPGHAGAQQPGMTGQVKEEIIARFGELGIRVRQGCLAVEPQLLRRAEFLDSPGTYRYMDVAGVWQEVPVPADGLAFSLCQVPVIYLIREDASPSLTLKLDNGEQVQQDSFQLTADHSSSLFLRDGQIRQITVVMRANQLFHDS